MADPRRGRSSEVDVYEVGPRDGLQNEASPVPTEAKIELVERLVAAGLRAVEVTSFVSPRAVPQLADADEVLAGVHRVEGVRYPVLVPNLRGYERAAAAGAREIAVFTAASESFNLRNIRCGIDESFERFRPVVETARRDGLRVRGYVSTAFHCPYEGAVAPTVVVDVVRRLVELGADEISIGDTIGAAVPTEVRSLLRRLREVGVPIARLALHLHDTRGTALANVVAGLEEGIRTFDSAAGGLGGCPYAPGASGNVATEDLVFLLERMGLRTGIDIEAVRGASRLVSEHLPGRRLPSRVFAAGPLAPLGRVAPKTEHK